MVLPGKTEIEIPLLKVLVEIGGQGRPRDIYPLVTKKFSQLTEEDVLKNLPSGRNKWTNLIQWTRLRLVKKGDMDSPSHGIWAITNKGRDRAKEINGMVDAQNYFDSPETRERPEDKHHAATHLPGHTLPDTPGNRWPTNNQEGDNMSARVMPLFKNERELVSKSLSPKLKELNYHVRLGVRLRGKHQKLKTEDSLSTAELDIKHSLSPDIDILYWEKDYSTEPDLHAVEVKYYRYDIKNLLRPPMYDGIGEAILLGTFGVDYVHLWHFFDPGVSDDDYYNHKYVLETALNKISMVNYECTRLTLGDKKRRRDIDYSDKWQALGVIMTYFLDEIKKRQYSSNSLRYDPDAEIIRKIIKKAYRIV